MTDQNTSKYTLTREEVASRLGVSTSTVRRMEFLQLHPVQDMFGRWLFDAAELENIPTRRKREALGAAAPQGVAERRQRAREGRLAARVFRMFERGATLPQVVIALNQTPETVRDFYRQWSTSLEEGEWQRQDENNGSAGY